MPAKGKGKGLEQLMLEAARHGWSGVPVWASDKEVEEVKKKHPLIFHDPERDCQRLIAFNRTVRLQQDASVPEDNDAHSSDYDEEDCVLQHGVSTVAAAGKARHWVSERYAVRNGIINDILMRLQLPRPEVDVFADKKNKKMARWFGPGGEVEDAFEVDWSQQGLMWMNPPYSELGKTVRKIIKEKGSAIMVLPDWRSRTWWKDIQRFVVRRYWYPPGTKIFELEGSDFDAGTKWGVWAYYVDCKEEHAGEDDDFIQPGKVYRCEVLDGTHQDTTSSRRRRRRKAVQKYWQGVQ